MEPQEPVHGVFNCRRQCLVIKHEYIPDPARWFGIDARPFCVGRALGTKKSLHGIDLRGFCRIQIRVSCAIGFHESDSRLPITMITRKHICRRRHDIVAHINDLSFRLTALQGCTVFRISIIGPLLCSYRPVRRLVTSRQRFVYRCHCGWD
jgi:hypothetical protein